MLTFTELQFTHKKVATKSEVLLNIDTGNVCLVTINVQSKKKSSYYWTSFQIINKLIISYCGLQVYLLS